MTATADQHKSEEPPPATGNDRRRLTNADLTRLAFVLIVYLFLVFLSFNQVDEDAYIYFRVAENISEGHGYVFNRGDEAVEVGSSNLWLLLLVLLAKAPLDIVWGAKLLGVACGAGVLFMTYALSRRLSTDPLIPMFASLLTAASAPFLFWSQRGLESPLHTLLLVSLVYVTIDRSRFKYAPAILALMMFGRPETPLLILGILPALYLCNIRFREMVIPALVLAAIALVQELIRYLYFGDLLPQAFYLKMSHQLSGVRQVAAYFQLSHISFMAIPLAVSIFRRSFWSSQVVIVIGYACALLAWPCFTFDLKPFFRFLAPAVPLIWILLTHGFQYVVPRNTLKMRGLVYAYCCFVWFFSALLPNLHTGASATRGHPWPTTEALRRFGDDPIGYTRATIAKIRRPYEPNTTDNLFIGSIGSHPQWLVGEFVDRNYPEGILVIYDQMGQAPYRAGHDKTFVDSFGLTDRRTGYHAFLKQKKVSALVRAYRRLFFIAVVNRTAKDLIYPTRKDILDELFEDKPDLIIVNAFVVRYARGSTTAAMVNDPRLRRDYRHTFTLNGNVSVHERKGLRRTTEEVARPDGLSVVEVQETSGSS